MPAYKVWSISISTGLVGLRISRRGQPLGFNITRYFQTRTSFLFQHFDWSMKIQSVILSSFFWGYIVLQIPGGELAARFGGSILITICIAINAAVSVLIPHAAFYVWFVCYLITKSTFIEFYGLQIIFDSHHSWQLTRRVTEIVNK